MTIIGPSQLIFWDSLSREQRSFMAGMSALTGLTQMFCLLIALYIRISGLFKGGPLRLSRCTSRTFIVALSLLPLTFLATPFAGALGIPYPPFLMFIIVLFTAL